MAEINIPTTPLDDAPYDAIRRQQGETMFAANTAALAHTLDGVELGEHDHRIIAWLSHWEHPTVAAVCSLILRARNAETAGRIVLDEPAELGIGDDEADGRDTVAIVNDEIMIYTRGAYWLTLDADEADEWAAHLAGMARALRAQAAGGGT